ncbi:MAG: hypothetical protein KAU95_00235 [Candidatus Aenigmarchaeota archaeon]|nr:hypothetical protein [Candidatus Aenigmarchaeota archaeon]
MASNTDCCFTIWTRGLVGGIALIIVTILLFIILGLIAGGVLAVVFYHIFKQGTVFLSEKQVKYAPPTGECSASQNIHFYEVKMMHHFAKRND